MKPHNSSVSLHNPSVSPAQSPDESQISPVPQIIPETPFNDEDPPEPDKSEKRIHKPTIKLKKIIEGHAVMSNLLSAWKHTVGTSYHQSLMYLVMFFS